MLVLQVLQDNRAAVIAWDTPGIARPVLCWDTSSTGAQGSVWLITPDMGPSVARCAFLMRVTEDVEATASAISVKLIKSFLASVLATKIIVQAKVGDKKQQSLTVQLTLALTVLIAVTLTTQSQSAHTTAAVGNLVECSHTSTQRYCTAQLLLRSFLLLL